MTKEQVSYCVDRLMRFTAANVQSRTQRVQFAKGQLALDPPADVKAALEKHASGVLAFQPAAELFKRYRVIDPKFDVAAYRAKLAPPPDPLRLADQLIAKLLATP